MAPGYLSYFSLFMFEGMRVWEQNSKGSLECIEPIQKQENKERKNCEPNNSLVHCACALSRAGSVGKPAVTIPRPILLKIYMFSLNV